MHRILEVSLLAKIKISSVSLKYEIVSGLLRADGSHTNLTGILLLYLYCFQFSDLLQIVCPT